MSELKPGMVFECEDRSLLWVIHVDHQKKLVYTQDDLVEPPCTRVIRTFSICCDLFDMFNIRPPSEEEAAQFVSMGRTTLVDLRAFETIPSPPNFESLKPTP